MSAHPDQRASLLTIGLLILLGAVTLPGGIGELIARLHAPAMSTREADAVTAGSLVLDFFGTLALALCTEVVSLVWKYFFCAVCCPGCLPAAQSSALTGATIFV